ncbi:MAG: hypothetical protein FWF84_04630, partial [Kiritimatiellaeota bacterium]|nr:hypothetical protein [Kiritimatiellota bacterium]
MKKKEIRSSGVQEFRSLGDSPPASDVEKLIAETLAADGKEEARLTPDRRAKILATRWEKENGTHGTNGTD